MKRYCVRMMQQREGHVVAPDIKEAERIARASMRPQDRLLEILEVDANAVIEEQEPTDAA